MGFSFWNNGGYCLSFYYPFPKNQMKVIQKLVVICQLYQCKVLYRGGICFIWGIPAPFECSPCVWIIAHLSLYLSKTMDWIFTFKISPEVGPQASDKSSPIRCSHRWLGLDSRDTKTQAQRNSFWCNSGGQLPGTAEEAALGRAHALNSGESTAAVRD